MQNVGLKMHFIGLKLHFVEHKSDILWDTNKNKLLYQLQYYSNRENAIYTK
jgi:hypothetical protein